MSKSENVKMVTVKLPATISIAVAGRQAYALNLADHTDASRTGVCMRFIVKAAIYAQNRATSEHKGKTAEDKAIRDEIARNALVELEHGIARSRNVSPELQWIRDQILKSVNPDVQDFLGSIADPKTGHYRRNAMGWDFCEKAIGKSGAAWEAVKAKAEAEIARQREAEESIAI